MRVSFQGCQTSIGASFPCLFCSSFFFVSCCLLLCASFPSKFALLLWGFLTFPMLSLPLLATLCSLLSTRYSLLATLYSLLSTLYSLLSTLLLSTLLLSTLYSLTLLLCTPYSNTFRESDETLTRILDGMVMWTQSDFKMRAEFQCPLNEAIDCMSRLTLECVTPLEKLLCLKKCHDEINRAVERNLTRCVFVS